MSDGSSSSRITGGICDGNECAEGGNLFCAGYNLTCNTIDDFPCIECLQNAAESSSRASQHSSAVGGVCDGSECIMGGDSFCAGFGLTCNTTNELPCIRCIAGESSRSSAHSGITTSSSTSSQRSSSTSTRTGSSSRRSTGSNAGNHGGDDSGDDGGDDAGNTGNVWYCGDGILTGSEQCDDGNEESGDGCSARCVRELLSCNGNECAAGGNDVCASFGQSCITTNTLPCIQCVAGSTGGQTPPQCNGNACNAGGNAICGDYNMTCVEDGENPCFLCEAAIADSSISTSTIAVMNCSGRECAEGGMDVCSSFGLTCTETGDVPCVSCVNATGFVVQPSCAVDGCAAGGSDVCGAQGLGCRASTTGACFECTNKEGTMVAVASPFVCGNGLQEPGEQCDKGAQNSDAMNAICRTNCRLAGCGDGILDTPLEVCDDGNVRNGDGCSMLCTLERGAPDTATLPGQVIELPFLPGNGSMIGSVTNPSGIAPSTPAPLSTPDTGPAALAVMAAGAAAGYSWMRRRR